jgi:hypothetical protein
MWGCRMATNRHVACPHVAETADFEYPGCGTVRHPSAQLREQITHLRSCTSRDDFTQRELRSVRIRIGATTTGLIPSASKPKSAEHSLNTLGADVLNAFRFSTIHARSLAKGVSVRLAGNNLDLQLAQQLLTFL